MKVLILLSLRNKQKLLRRQVSTCQLPPISEKKRKLSTLSADPKYICTTYFSYYIHTSKKVFVQKIHAYLPLPFRRAKSEIFRSTIFPCQIGLTNFDKVQHYSTNYDKIQQKSQIQQNLTD